MADLLAPVEQVNPAQLLRDQWERAVQDVDLMKIVGFVRESPTLRNDGPSCAADESSFRAVARQDGRGASARSRPVDDPGTRGR